MDRDFESPVRSCTLSSVVVSSRFFVHVSSRGSGLLVQCSAHPPRACALTTRPAMLRRQRYEDDEEAIRAVRNARGQNGLRRSLCHRRLSSRSAR